MSKTPDLTYSTDGMFVTFYAETDAGQNARNTMAETNEGCGCFYTWQKDSVIKQLRDAGYIVHKAKKSKGLTEKQLNELLSELNDA
jgi:hypothetical protein